MEKIGEKETKRDLTNTIASPENRTRGISFTECIFFDGLNNIKLLQNYQNIISGHYLNYLGSSLSRSGGMNGVVTVTNL